MNEATKTKLAAVSTATLTTVLFKRGFRNVFLGAIIGHWKLPPSSGAYLGMKRVGHAMGGVARPKSVTLLQRWRVALSRSLAKR